MRDYGKYKDFYAPNVIESRVFRQTDTEDTFSLRMLNKAVVAKFALDTEFHNSFTRLDDNRSYNVSYTTCVREVENYGTPDEHEGPGNIGSGLLWRPYSISRFEQRDGGVSAELEAVALSRDIPGGLRWLVDPVVRRTSKGSISVSLQKTEEAVLQVSLAARDKEVSTPATSAFSSGRSGLDFKAD